MTEYPREGLERLDAAVRGLPVCSCIRGSDVRQVAVLDPACPLRATHAVDLDARDTADAAGRLLRGMAVVVYASILVWIFAADALHWGHAAGSVVACILIPLITGVRREGGRP